MNFRKNLQYDFPKNEGGGQRPFGTFPKIHPFWKGKASLSWPLKTCRAATGVLSNIDHQKKPEYWPNIDHTALYWPNIDRKSSLKSAHLHHKKNEYRPNIDHTALYRPNIDRKSSLKSAHLQYLLLSPEIYIFWENEAFHEIWGINEDHFNWGNLGKHCIWTTLHYADPIFRPLERPV